MRGRFRTSAIVLASSLGVVFATVFGGSAGATMIVPMDPDDLAASSEVVVLGTVDHIRQAELASGRIVTVITIDLEEVWKGNPPSPLEIVEPGGIVGDRGEIVYGTPSYELGEPVLVFAARTALGWRTNHMLQGKFRVRDNQDGTRSALRQVEPGVAVLASPARPWRSEIPLTELRDATEATVGTNTGASHAAGDPPRVIDFIADDIVDEVTSEFTTLHMNPRFFGADTGQPLRFVIDSRGDDILGLEVSRRAVDDAFAAWNAISGTSLELVDGGLTDDISTDPVQGVHKILFNDPGDEIFDPFNCTGTLGVGGSQFTTAEIKSFGGTTYRMILSAKVTFADNWDGCSQWKECNFSEVAAHEGGHSFGLGHSSENRNEGNPALRDALMFFLAHFDGRCAAPRADDEAGIRSLYPDPAPLGITTASPLPEAVAGQAYSVELETTGATGAVAWTRTGTCNGSDGGLQLTSSGVVTGPLDDNVVGGGCIEAIATDASGNSHQKRFDIAFVLTPSSPTPTAIDLPTIALRSATPTHTELPPPTLTNTPAPTDTPSPTIPAVRPCVGDCNGDGMLSISELIRGVNIALGSADVSSCASFDRDGNGQVSINELIQAVQAALGGCTVS